MSHYCHSFDTLRFRKAFCEKTMPHTAQGSSPVSTTAVAKHPAECGQVCHPEATRGKPTLEFTGTTKLIILYVK